ncbi:MAG: transglycosylase SLT domain-containing protein [Burkholderiaceae bacterium]|jgi:membrane-bound lytic murein transglycosylase D|nr:transglycosylase SLT domain-containing protein [Burkholderiaceae bacterium]
MTYKRHCFHILATILSTTFFLAVPNISPAGDISLPRYSKDARLAAFHTPSGMGLSRIEVIEDDPVTEVLSMYEVDIWDRIRRGFAIPDLENPRVTSHENYYLKNQDYFDRMTSRSSLYLFHIVQELEKRGMPTELALLPFIESAFNPYARSSAKAEGMWQFIPSTGRHYDLAQSVFRDDRRCVLSSTEAALNYLQNLYSMFGDWHLALAAYNWGEGSVSRAVRKNRARLQPVDFNSISARMPAETRNYVPKLQAVKNMIAHPDQYDIRLPKIENQPYFVKIGKTHDIDVKVAAKLAELSIDDFRALNPQFGQYVITGGPDVSLLLPRENAQKFKENLENWKQPLSSWTAYQVMEKRETVESIAEKYHTTPDVIRHANHIPSRMALKFGSTVLVPKLASSGNRNETDIAPEVSANGKLVLERIGAPTRIVKVKVRKKDSLASIAKRYKTSVDDIKSWNQLTSNRVASGSILRVHVPAKAAPAPSRRNAKKVRSRNYAAAKKQKPANTTTSKNAHKQAAVVHEPKHSKSGKKDV